MREDKSKCNIGVKQTFLVAHDEAVGILVRRRVATRILGFSQLVLREASIVDFSHVKGDQDLVNRLGRQFVKSLLEPLSDLAKTGRAILVVDAIVGGAINKKERKNLDAFAFKGGCVPSSGAAQPSH